MAQANQNCNSCSRLDKQRRAAWAKWYAEVEATLDSYMAINQAYNVLKKEQIPLHFINEFMEMAEQLQKRITCPVCLEVATKDNYEVSYCGHIYCGDCLKTIKASNNKSCAVCRRKL